MNREQGFGLRFLVRREDAGRLLGFLRPRIVEAHGSQLSLLFNGGHVTVDGRLARPEDTIVAGSEVELFLPDHNEQPVATNWQVLWGNDELLAVFKPHMLPVSRTTRNLYNTLISLVRRETPYEDARLLHRLDTETAGVILLAKNRAADQKWKPRLDQLIVRKIYHAWVTGRPDWQERLYECFLSEKPGSLIRSQVYVVPTNESKLYLKPRYSKTAFRVLYSESGRALVECELYTGRKHQIRAQLASLGHPLIGDKLYAHDGHFYLKRIDHGLTQADYESLGAEHHLLEAVQCVINPEGKEVIINSKPTNESESPEQPFKKVCLLSS
ncbi:RluA family pseudouridine synthase [Amphritea sp. HPY]|uniref:RluA family pseudouridine synthase n=1 Tax=Amphritea sp. HPY TaxID=3421652 RepID=UPI003D7D49AB